MSKSSKFVLGAIIGAAAAALLTPVSGKKARDKVKSAAGRAGIDTKELEKKVKSLAQKGGRAIESAVAAVQEKAQGTKTKTKSK